MTKVVEINNFIPASAVIYRFSSTTNSINIVNTFLLDIYPTVMVLTPLFTSILLIDLQNTHKQFSLPNYFDTYLI